jgi:uncharacterized RmlC-like cupin family protein
MQYQSIVVVRPGLFSSATAQTPGSQRLAAIHPEAGIDSPMWGGIFCVEPAARTAIHHHGEQHTIAYVLSGSAYIRWGERGEFDATLHAGDFPTPTDNVSGIPIHGQVKVVSMIGDLALSGKAHWHTHMVIGLPDGKTESGHVLDAHVSPTPGGDGRGEPNSHISGLTPEADLTLIDHNKETKLMFARRESSMSTGERNRYG